MIPGAYSFRIYKGITFGPYVFTCKDSDGLAVDLTGWSAFSTVRDSNGSIAFDFAPTITSPSLGKVTFDFTDTETNQLPCGRFVWDLVLENAAGERLGPFVQGRVTVAEVNTQPA